MGRLFRRTKAGAWWGDWTDATGKRTQRSLRTADRTVARERLRDAELAAAPPSTRGRRQRLSAAIDHVIGLMHDKAEGTRHMYRTKGRRIAATLGDPWIQDITRDMVSEYIKRRLSKERGHGNAMPHTIQKELITIRRALKEAHQRDVLATMPSLPSFSPRYVPRETWLLPAQFDALSAKLPAKRRLWATLAALGGMRAGEVERLQWEMVDLEHNRIRVPGTKTATARRTIPIAPALRHQLASAPHAPTGKVAEIWTNVRRELHAACVAAKVPKVSPNDLRRTFASWLAQQGVPLLTIATLLGHGSTRMVEKVYGKLSAQNMDDAIASLPVTPVSQNLPVSPLLPPTNGTGEPDEEK